MEGHQGFEKPGDDFRGLDLSINGRNIEDIFDEKNAGFLNETVVLLKEIGIDLDRDREILIELVESLDQGNILPFNVPNALKGIAGFSTLQFIKQILFPERRCIISGKIRDYAFVKDSDGGQGPQGSVFVATGNGHLAVEMITLEFESQEKLELDNPFRKTLIHWDIDVFPNGYKVYERVPGPEPKNPPPDFLPFPIEPGILTFSPGSIADIWSRGLDHKILARGPESISIHHIYQQIDDGSIERLNENSDSRYHVTSESCIDLMFANFPPATVLPSQRGYCLGRCDHPNIVNTGGGT